MDRPGIVLDTCVLGDKDFLGWLSGYHGTKVISSVTYMEFVYYIIMRGESPDKFRNMLRSLRIQIENFNTKNANIAVETRVKYGDVAAVNCPECGERIKMDWCDLMIASHALFPPWIVVTNNVKDFDFLGDRAMKPQRFMKKFNKKE